VIILIRRRSTNIRIAPESGAELHRRLLSTIVGFVQTIFCYTLLAPTTVLTSNRAPFLYFSTTEIGVILNRLVRPHSRGYSVLTCCRFSQDMQLVDRQLPGSLMSISNRMPSPDSLYPGSNISIETFKLLVQTTLLFSTHKLMALSLPLCILAVYLIQRIYLRTSRQLRLLDLESQSAVYSSFLESVGYTIRYIIGFSSDKRTG
jgi:hypothetical protein